MKEFRYVLEKGTKKHLCPACGKRRFVRYIDTETNGYLPEKYGRCDRESNCTYHLTPYADGYGTKEAKQYQYKPQPKPQQQPVYFIPEGILNATLKDYDNNTFVQNLLKLAPIEEVEKVISLYRIGTISKGERSGAVTFPFIDKAGNIRTIQAKEFNETNHTIKNGTDFVHAIITRYYTNKGEALPGWLQDYNKNEKFVSCLFGEHLLNKYPCNPVALVEAPKTAIIGALYYGLPETPNALLWISVYNKSSLSIEKCKALKGRKVVLFPDLNAFTEWNNKAQELKAKLPGTRFIVSDLLEKNATEAERMNGLDLVDFITRFDYKLFRREPEPITPQASQCSHSEAIEQPEPIPGKEHEPIINSEKNESVKQSFFEQITPSFNPDNWINEIELLENFFTNTQLREAPVKLSPGVTIIDLPKFIDSHLTTVKKYNGNPLFKPHLHRLQLLKEITQN